MTSSGPLSPTRRFYRSKKKRRGKGEGEIRRRIVLDRKDTTSLPIGILHVCTQRVRVDEPSKEVIESRGRTIPLLFSSLDLFPPSYFFALFLFLLILSHSTARKEKNERNPLRISSESMKGFNLFLTIYIHNYVTTSIYLRDLIGYL